MNNEQNLNEPQNQQLNIAGVRQRALDWWNKLPIYNMDKPCKRVYSNLYFEREPSSLTGREIEAIYNAEHVA